MGQDMHLTTLTIFLKTRNSAKILTPFAAFVRTRHLVVLHLIGGLPDFEEADCRVEAVENGERHGDVRDDGPGPDSEEFEMLRSVLCVAFVQRVDGPHGHVGDEEEGDEFASRLAARLLHSPASTSTRVQDQQRLQRRLHQRPEVRHQTQARVLLEVAAHDREHAVDVHARLRHQQQGVVQADAFAASVGP